MLMTRERKAKEISALSERFGQAKAAFVVDFKGMNVEQVTALRKKLRPAQAKMKVVRNTLAKRALIDHPSISKALSDDLVGTNAVIFALGSDVAAPAKALAEFSKDVPHLVIKTGYMDGTKLDEKKIKYLATLPSKDVLRAQFLGVLTAPMSKFVRTLNEVPSGFVRVLNVYKEKKS